MNCQESPQLECRCCEECIHSQNERFRRKNCHEDCEKPSSPSNWRNGSCYEGHTRTERRPCEHGKPSPHRSNNYDEKQWVDANTLRTLSSLREKACKFLETSESTRSADEDECSRPYTRVKESHPCDGSTRMKVQDIDYEPQSNFLKKMKQKVDPRTNDSEACPCTPTCECTSYPRERQSRRADESCFTCMRSADDYTPPLNHGNRQIVTEKASQYSDTSSGHSPCKPCCRTWKTKSPEEEYPCEIDLIKEYNELCRELSEFQNNLETLNDGAEDEDDDTSPRDPCEHVSRSGTRQGRKGSRTGGKSCQTSDNTFEPSLKKPYPNSCERCWRYASPCRSPVNKPSQRFDPNFRKSHSDVCLNTNGKEKGGQSLEKQESNYDCDERETKVHQLMSTGSRLYSPVGRPSRSLAVPSGGNKSSEDCKRSQERSEKGGGGGCGTSGGTRTCGGYGTAGGRGISGGRGCCGTGTGLSSGGSRGAGAGAKTLSDTANMKSQSRGDGREGVTVNFDVNAQKKDDSVPASKKPERRCPKSVKKPVGGGRPSTSGTGSGAKLEKEAKCKTAVAIPTSASKVKPCGKTTPESFDRGRGPTRGEEIVRGTSSGMRRSSTKPPQTASAQSRSECTHKQKMPYGSAMGGHQSRLDSSSSCLCRNLSRQDGRRCPIHGSDNSPKREITSSAHRCGNCSFCRNSPSRPSRGGGRNAFENVPDGRKKAECPNHRQERSNSRKESGERQNNPRKYCVFYMNQTKLNRADDIEILIEELTEGKKRKDSSEERLKEKMKRIQDVRGDSMALRFQKGVSQHCQRPESNRVLYF